MSLFISQTAIFTELYQVHGGVVVVVQFQSGFVPITELAGFTRFLLQLFAFHLATSLDSGPLSFSNQSSLSSHFASSRSCLINFFIFVGVAAIVSTVNQSLFHAFYVSKI